MAVRKASGSGGTPVPVPSNGDPWRVRLLGGFDVEPAASAAQFESQKVRALFAYLLTHANRSVARDHLAGLLWPDKAPDAGRRNLRQALYNLKTVLGEGTALDAEPQTVTLHLSSTSQLDVAAFEEALQNGFHGREVDLQELSRASQLFRGDFLEGFHLKDSSPFQEWQLAQQQRLRELAIQVEKTLADEHVSRGEHPLAMKSAQRALELDPLSEPAHRDMMRLLALSGRRSRALVQYEQLTRTLRRELGVEPDHRTREIYRAILAEEVPETLLPRSAGPVGPVVPLVAREGSLLRLKESWEQALAGGTRVALVAGEQGIGKTRLVRAFLHRIASKKRPEVLLGRCSLGGPPTSFEPLPELLRSAVADRLPSRVDEPQAALPALLARIGDLLPDTGEPCPEAPVARLAVLLARSLCSTQRPVVWFLDNLHYAPESTFRLLAQILPAIADLPVWVVVAATVPDPPPWPEPGVPVDHVRLHRIGDEACPAIARALLHDTGEAERLIEVLTRHCEGLPLKIVETVNLLCDRGQLVPAEPGGWSLDAEVDADSLPERKVDELLHRRLERLPTSTRRLLCLATVMGRRFDVELLCRAGREHMAVVEIGVELMIERWLVRQFIRHWATHPRERDLVLWAHGARRGSFEFAHTHIRETALGHLPRRRRRQLHRHVAEAYAEDQSAAPWSEEIGYHWLQAGEHARAVPHLEAAAVNARVLGDEVTESWYQQALVTARAGSC